MKNIHFGKHARRYFEGWFLKHENGTRTAAFIPGVSFDPSGKPKAFIQVNHDGGSHSFDFEFGEFEADKRSFSLRIGDNSFGESGIKINIDRSGFLCKGEIKYGELRPPRRPVMGPLQLVPMPCNHEILSMRHPLSGELQINGERIVFDGGRGYIEKDRGRSFPRTYSWFHSAGAGAGDAITAAVAEIPVLGIPVRGHFALVRAGGREYLFATYNGGHVVECAPGRMILRRGKYLLEIYYATDDDGAELFAPERGAMTRKIREQIACPADITLSESGRKIFSWHAARAGAEYAE